MSKMILAGPEGCGVRIRSLLEVFQNKVRSYPPGWMPFHFPDGNANWLTNAALDKFCRIPEYKVCAIKIEKITE